MMGAICEANCFSNPVEMGSNSHVLGGVLFSRLKTSCDSCRLEVAELRVGTFLLTMTGGSTERVAAHSEELSEVIGRQLVWGALSWWLKQRVDNLPQGSWIASARVNGWQPELLWISTGTADAVCRTVDDRLSPTQQYEVDGTVAPVS